MELNTLKKIRLIYPGLVVLLILIALYYSKDGDIINNFAQLNLNMALPAIIIFLVGCLYYAFDIRKYIWNRIIEKVNDNIRKRLLTIAKIKTNEINLSDKQKASILNSVFYSIVDNDSSLTCKAKNVRFNGCVLSCTVDTILICPFGILSFIIKTSIEKQSLPVFFWILLVVEIIFIPAFFKLLHKHISLSNEQIDIINDRYEKECKEEMLKILNPSE